MSSLSNRAARNLQSNEAWKLLLKVFSNPYSKENPEGIVSMGIAENKLMHQEIVDYLNKHMRVHEKLLTYNDGPTGSIPLKNALSLFINANFSPLSENMIESQHISILSGVGACLDALCFCIANEGDAILLVRPAYMGFDGDLKDRAGMDPIYVSIGEHDLTGLESVRDHERAILEAQQVGKTVKALLFCNPHNPLGRCYSKEVVEAYLALCGKYKIHLISDEVYAEAVFPTKEIPDPVPFTSVLSLEIKKFIDPSFVHVLYGMSKDFSCNGLRIGAVISQANSPLHWALSTVSKFSWSSSLSDHAWTLILTDEKWHTWYFETMIKRMTAGYERCVDFLRELNIPYVPANCGPFIWFDLTGYLKDQTTEAERALAEITIDHGVWIATGESYRSEVPGWFRITFAVSDEEFSIGIARLRKALEFAKASNDHKSVVRGDATVSVVGDSLEAGNDEGVIAEITGKFVDVSLYTT